LPSIFIVEKVRNRRLITVVAAALSRVCWLVIALSPFLFPVKTAVAVLLVLLAVLSALGAVGGCSWNSWMRDVIPERVMGSFFFRRMRVATGIGIGLSLLAAAYLDLWKRQFHSRSCSGIRFCFCWASRQVCWAFTFWPERQS
jgi:vacuolar-type H+-ATPase subunit I/STV1